MKNQTGERMLWLLGGVGIGATLALLFAPKTGRDMRRHLARVAEDSRDRVVESGQERLQPHERSLRARQSGCRRSIGLRGARPPRDKPLKVDPQSAGLAHSGAFERRVTDSRQRVWFGRFHPDHHLAPAAQV